MKRGMNQCRAIGVAYLLAGEPFTDDELIGRQIVYADGAANCYTIEIATITAADVARARAYNAGTWKPDRRLAAQRMTAYLAAETKGESR